MKKVNFKQLRGYKGKTQEDVCKNLGLSVNYLSLIENYHREPSWKVFTHLCDYLGYEIFFELTKEK